MGRCGLVGIHCFLVIARICIGLYHNLLFLLIIHTSDNDDDDEIFMGNKVARQANAGGR